MLLSFQVLSYILPEHGPPQFLTALCLGQLFGTLLQGDHSVFHIVLSKWARPAGWRTCTWFGSNIRYSPVNYVTVKVKSEVGMKNGQTYESP